MADIELPEDVNERIAMYCEEKPHSAPGRGEATRTRYWIYMGFQWESRYAFRGYLDACAEFEALLEERDHVDAYLDALFRVRRVTGSSNPMDYCKAILFATAEERCTAMLRVMEGER
jgi:hypothetical protein